jgi:hypothetical protein
MFILSEINIFLFYEVTMPDNRFKVYAFDGLYLGVAIDIENAQRLLALWIEFNQPKRTREKRAPICCA